jgi:hypothetical protein
MVPNDDGVLFYAEPLVSGKIGDVSWAASGVSTWNPVKSRFEAGLGGAFSFKLPGGITAVVWANARIDDEALSWIGDRLIDKKTGKPFEGTVSVNLGAGFSVDQAGALVAGATGRGMVRVPVPAIKAIGGGMVAISGALKVAGEFANEFAGLGFRGEGVFKDGRLVSIRVAGREITDLKEFAENALGPLLAPLLAQRTGPQPDVDGVIAQGVNPDRADIVAQFLAGRNTQEFFQQTADYLGASPRQVAEWFNQQDREWLQLKFAWHSLGPVRPDANGHYDIDAPTRPYSAIQVSDNIPQMVRDAAALNRPFPGTRNRWTQAAAAGPWPPIVRVPR